MKYGRHPKFTNISQRQKEKWGQENYEAHIFWNKKTPEINASQSKTFYLRRKWEIC